MPRLPEIPGLPTLPEAAKAIGWNGRQGVRRLRTLLGGDPDVVVRPGAKYCFVRWAVMLEKYPELRDRMPTPEAKRAAELVEEAFDDVRSMLLDHERRLTAGGL